MKALNKQNDTKKNQNKIFELENKRKIKNESFENERRKKYKVKN